MGRVASAGDNATMESWHALLRKSVLDRRLWRTRTDLHEAIVFWIEHTYNRRRQRALGKLTSVEYELALTTQVAAVAAQSVSTAVNQSCSSPDSSDVAMARQTRMALPRYPRVVVWAGITSSARSQWRGLGLAALMIAHALIPGEIRDTDVRSTQMNSIAGAVQEATAWMDQVEGVQGVGEGRTPQGDPCVNVYLASGAIALEDIPDQVQGVPVRKIDVGGEIQIQPAPR